MLFSKKKKLNPELGKIIVSEDSVSRTDGYNKLKDNILFLNADNTKKVIQIESSVKGEGKTTVSCNLAVSLGLTDKKVVVVDLDFHRPRVHHVFEVEKENGIAEYILGNATIDQITKKTDKKNVDVITRGAEVQNSALVFVSEKFKNMIKELREKYDYVLLDCAPVLLISDYIHICSVSDGVIFMVAHGSTTRAQVKEAVDELRKNGAEILGSVFTMYDRKKDKSYSGKSYYGSYY